MRLGVRFKALILLIFLPVGLWLSFQKTSPQGETWLQLTDVKTGRKIISTLLPSGETVILSWKNSLFRLMVTEVFIARSGVLEQTGISFADPRGGDPPSVKPEDVEDLYHTGGPFKAQGHFKTIRCVTYRVGEIGDPHLKIGHRSVALTPLVGFGGAVRLEVQKPGFYLRTVGRFFL